MIKQGDFIIEGSSVAVSAAAPRESEMSPRYGNFGVAGQGRTTRRFADKYGYSPDTGAFPYDPLVSRSVDNWRAGTYRSPDTRGTNRFSPGYTNSPRYTTPGRAGTSQALASGLDALSLNKMNVNPDMVDAAWQAFWSTLSNNSGAAAAAAGAGANAPGSGAATNPGAKW
ncbi:unnamed protein product [Gongylonema pulchrum]|nr:unnamed protein product [Gongylonema pulchrum]